MSELNIYQRLLAIVDEAGALEKTGEGGGPMSGKKFHAVDHVVDSLRPLFVKHRVFPEISVLECSSRDIEVTRAGGYQGIDHYAEVQMTVSFVNVDDPEDKTPPLGSFGGGLDTSDKAVGKAISYALKSFMLANLQLRGNADNETRDSARRPADAPTPQYQGSSPLQSPQQAAALPPIPPPQDRYPPQQGYQPPPAQRQFRTDPLADQVTAHLKAGNVPAAWTAIGSAAQEARLKWGQSLRYVKPQQLKVFYAKAHAAGVSAEVMKEWVYESVGIDRETGGVEDHLSLVPGAVVQAVLTAIEGGGCLPRDSPAQGDQPTGDPPPADEDIPF